MPESRQELRTKLQKKLRELFQFDVSDLDFGIYRILNRKRDEIEEFIEEDLLNAIEKGLEKYTQDDESQLDELREEIKSTLGEQAFENGGIAEQYQGTPLGKRYLEAKEKAEKQEVGEEIEKRIYQDLYTFFSRYYDDGDFLTQRRISTRDSKYAIPYNGEEVKLHWANKDQYYIKTGEHFANYKFEANGLKFWFKVQQAEVEKDNVKESDTRYFVLRPDDTIDIDEENDTLTLWFEYRPLTDAEEEKWLGIYNEAAGKSLKTIDRERLCTAFDNWVRSEVTGKWRDALSTTPEGKEHSLLYDKLNHYTGKNTTDYFIHKNLQDFLERELEYYLKHEVIQVDDFIKADSEQPLQTALTRAKVVGGIAEKVIAFLSQIEDFQKKLFEKKKFVVDTHYCFTMDKVPEELYEAILENKEQLEYWEDCYSMNQWEQNLVWNGEWTEAVLKSHPYMMVDTKFFDDDFKYHLLASFDDLDEGLGGVLVNGENYQSLRVFQEKYREKIKTIYIDPPYNTEKDREEGKFIYKDSFVHSSWLSLMKDRILVGKRLLRNDGTFFRSIDDNENFNLRNLLNSCYGEANFEGTIKWRRRHNQPNDKTKMLGLVSEYIISYAKDSEAYKNSGVGKIGLTGNFSNPDNDPRGLWASKPWKTGSNQGGTTYKIETPTGKEYEEEWMGDKDTYNELLDDKRIYFPDNGSGPPRKKYYKSEREEEGQCATNWWSHKHFGHNQEASSELYNLFGVKNIFSNPKPSTLIEGILNVSNAISDHDVVLDFFAGSGTTANSVMNLNKDDQSKREYILIEMGQYFDTVLKPRIQKVAFSDNWKDGVPQDKDGQSHAFKYHFIESYEDALNNIDFKNKEEVQQAMRFDDYMLKYMLDFETKGVSATLLKDKAFTTPFDYELNIQRGHESPAPEKVDLVETFHYLVGLWVQTLRRYEHQNRQYVVSKGEIRDEDAIEEVLVIWRNTEGLDLDKEAEWIGEEVIEDQTFDRIYVNGATKLKDAEPTEITFREKMFEGVA